MDKYILPIDSISKLSNEKRYKNEDEKENEIKNKHNNFDSYLQTSLDKLSKEEKQIRQRQNEGTKHFLENVKEQLIIKNEIAKTK